MIDWKKIEEKYGLTGRKLARLAGVSDSMWSQVKSQKRKLNPATQLLLTVRLTVHLDLPGANQLGHFIKLMEQNQKRFKETYPLEASCATKT